MLEDNWFLHGLFKRQDTLHVIAIGKEDSSIVAIIAAIVWRRKNRDAVRITRPIVQLEVVAILLDFVSTDQCV